MENSTNSEKKFNLPVKDCKEKLSPKQVILSLLRERNWTQVQLADKIGISRQGLNNYLRGHWDFPTSIKIKIAQAFEVDSLVIWELDNRFTPNKTSEKSEVPSPKLKEVPENE